MKKIILMAGLLLTSLVQAQDYSVTTDGIEITENQEFLFNILNSDPAGTGEEGRVHILLTNNTNASHKLGIRVNSYTNNNMGENGKAVDLQFCVFGTCYPSVSAKAYPTNGFTLAANASSDAADHFVNGYAGDVVGQDVTYSFSVILMDDIQNPVVIRNFSYRYSPLAGVDTIGSLENMGISINNTVVKTTLDLTANQEANLEVFSLTGQSVKKAAIANGAQAIDLSGLSAGIYIARFVTQDNKTSQIRIVKK